MLRRLSGSVAGGLRRSLSTAASRPPWALIHLTSVDESGKLAPGVSFPVDEPPSVTNLSLPAHFVHPRRLPDPETDKGGYVSGQIAATSSDGFLLLRFCEARLDSPALGDHTHSFSSLMCNLSWAGTDMNPEVVRFVCNPLSGELYRLPDLDGTKRTSAYRQLGLLTQSEGGDAPPGRYAVAEMFTAGTRGRSASSCGGFSRRQGSGTRWWACRPLYRLGGGWTWTTPWWPSATVCGGSTRVGVPSRWTRSATDQSSDSSSC